MNRFARVLAGGLAVVAVVGASTAAAVAGNHRAEDTIVVAAAPATSWQPLEIPSPPTTTALAPAPTPTVPAGSVRSGPYSASFDGVVRLRTRHSWGITIGTGFGVGDGTWLLTNVHVIDGASSIEVERWDGESIGTAQLVAVAAQGDDLALLKLTGAAVKPLGIRTKRASAREPLTTAGFPSARRLEREPATSRYVTTIGGHPVLVVEMQSEHGQSGSPIVDDSDQVVGVLYGGTDSGVTLAVPNDVVNALLTGQNVPVVVPAK